MIPCVVLFIGELQRCTKISLLRIFWCTAAIHRWIKQCTHNDWMWIGKEFQKTEAATGKERRPMVSKTERGNEQLKCKQQISTRSYLVPLKLKKWKPAHLDGI